MIAQRLPSILRPATAVAPVEPPEVLRRRRIVVLATLAVGAALLGATLAAPRGSGLFYGLGVAVAATWIGGSVLSGPLRLGRRGGGLTGEREVVGPALLGVALFAAFFVARVVGEHLPVVAEELRDVLAKADAGPVAAVLALALLNGLAEEVFFRGALHSAFDARHAVAASTVVYAVVTIATLNIALVIAALVMGTIFGFERRATGGILAPVVTHVTWSTLMLLLLPR